MYGFLPNHQLTCTGEGGHAGLGEVHEGEHQHSWWYRSQFSLVSASLDWEKYMTETFSEVQISIFTCDSLKLQAFYCDKKDGPFTRP
jgi:hypothetical protein